MGPSLSGHMMSRAIGHASTIQHGVSLVIEHGVHLPSRPVQVYHPCMTMCSDVSWDIHGDHGIPERGDDVSSVSTSETSASLGEDSALWHPNAAKKCGTGGKPSSVGGNALPPPAVHCPRYPRRTLTRLP